MHMCDRIMGIYNILQFLRMCIHVQTTALIQHLFKTLETFLFLLEDTASGL